MFLGGDFEIVSVILTFSKTQSVTFCVGLFVKYCNRELWLREREGERKRERDALTFYCLQL